MGGLCYMIILLLISYIIYISFFCVKIVRLNCDKNGPKWVIFEDVFFS